MAVAAVRSFEELREECLQKGELWEDPDFPATQASVFYHQTPPFTFEWKRPNEFTAEPVFISSDCQIVPGKLGDRWLAACLGCLRLTEGLLYRVVPADQSFQAEDGYAGIFRFRLWWGGEWQEVCVDDRLPTVKGQLVFMSGQNQSQLWPALLEKAYAKLHGSYEALKYGTLLDGIADLTGGISESITLKTNEINNYDTVIENLLKMTSVEKAPHAEKLPNGVVIGENYRILSVDSAYNNKTNDESKIVRLRSTTGIHRTPPSEILDMNNAKLSRGEFWMPFRSWVNTFTHLEVVHLDGDTSRDEPSLQDKIPWVVRLYQGQWRKGVSAGGCRNFTDTFHMNPQLVITVPDETDVILSVAQNNALEPQVIGFTGYDLSEEVAAADSHLDTSKQFFKTKRSLVNSQYTNSRQVTLRTKLNEGFYLILPTTYEPNQESMFIFRVLSRQPVRMKLHDSLPQLVRSPIVQAQSATKGLSQYQSIFMQVADEHKCVNAFELQELLDVCLPNDYIKSCASLEVCRLIIATFDSKGFGKINFKEFKDLICSIKFWQSAFKTHTKEKTGILKAERLREALLDVGFQLNSSVMGSIVSKYIRKDGTLRFGDFVGAILNLSIAFSSFRRKDQNQSGTVRLTQTEFLKLALTC